MNTTGQDKAGARTRVCTLHRNKEVRNIKKAQMCLAQVIPHKNILLLFSCFPLGILFIVAVYLNILEIKQTAPVKIQEGI